VGCPIRISTDQSLLAAPRGFSQRATSFIASWCQGIHRMPLSYSDPERVAAEAGYAHHARKPSSGSVAGFQSPVVRNNQRRITDARSERSSDLNHLRHKTRTLRHPLRRMENIRINSHNASEPSLPDLGARARRRNPKGGFDTRHTLPVRHQPDNGISCQSSVTSCQNVDNATSNRQPDYTHPETHQNLIHPDKEQNRRWNDD
jgi:hypothetical protein